jgi:hypothetical protein
MSTTTLRTRLAEATVAVEPPLVFRCEACDRPLEAVEFSTGRHWSIRGLAMRGRRKHKTVLCFGHYVDACRSAKRIDPAEPVPNETDGPAEQEKMSSATVPNETAPEPHPRPGWPTRVRSMSTVQPKLAKAEPAGWRFNMTRRGRREWPGRPPAEGAGGSQRATGGDTGA